MLSSTIVPVDSLLEYQLAGMWSLFQSYYQHVDQRRFLADLKAKDQVILLTDGNQIAGFSTLKTFVRQLQGRSVTVIYSGDTIVHNQYWGQTALQKTFFNLLVSTYLKNPTRDVYWFLISKGYKTYCLLSRNFPHYWPRHDAATPSFEQALLAELASDMFGSAWQPHLGVLQFDTCLGSLKGNVAPITDEERQFADIRFFEQINPGHAQGDELCCLGKIDAALMLSYPRKLLKRRYADLLGGSRDTQPALR